MKKLIKLYQPSCAPCEMVENYLQSKKVSYESFNVQDNPDVAAKYGVMSTPVTILLDEDGNELQRTVGFKPPEIEKLILLLN